MNVELKDQWCKALRSGKYEQGLGTLRTKSNKFCCLGVLQAVMEPGVAIPLHMDFISFSLATRAGLKAGDQEKLVRLNDTENRPFPEIADWIEVNL